MTSPGTNENGIILSLEYEDPPMAIISPDDIIQRGRHVRRRNRAVQACATLFVAVIVAVVVNAQLMSPPEPAKVSPMKLLAATSAYQLHAPAATPVVVDQSVPGWRSFAWLSVDGRFCSGTIGVSSQDRGAVGITCAQPVGLGAANKNGPASAAPLTEPVFQALPPPNSPSKSDMVLVIGLARNDVASVEIDFMGSSIFASIYPIEVGSTVRYVVYSAWLPVKGASSYGTSDISALIARSKTGNVLTG